MYDRDYPSGSGTRMDRQQRRLTLRRTLTLSVVAAAAALTLAIVFVAFAPRQPASSAPADPPIILPTTTIEVLPDVTVAVIGDSLSAGANRTWPEGAWDPKAWPMYADRDGLDITAGYALSGADSSEILPHVTNWGTDAVVILVGTNDVQFRTLNLPDSRARVEQMALTSGASEVFIVALPPAGRGNARDIAGFDYLNGEYDALAREYGWHFIDAFASVRDGSGYVAGTTTDGTHMTPDTAAAVGTIIRSEVLSAFDRDDEPQHDSPGSH